MTDFNQAIVLGNLTKDPEFKYTPNGQAVVNFSVATNRRWTTQEGNQQENTQFHNIVAWGKLAEICNKILYKGRKTLVVGRLQTRNWEGQDGVKRYTTEIVADHISATGAPRSGGEEGFSQEMSSKNDGSPTKPVKNENKKEEKNDKKEDEIDLDDIPF
jgi:single-strand DNA-binding protein